MKTIGFAVLALAALAPAGARAAAFVDPMDAGGLPSGAFRPSTAAVPDRFSLGGLSRGVDRVLASVDDPAPGIPLPATSPHEAAAADPVPEPATWLMMILGFLGLSFAVRRRSGASGTRVRFS